tara:strand:- start:707 stop:1075 length:369 start_codon:yes stop_codon:yes gene_type:complete
MAFALGKFAYGICDRCGFRVRFLQMRMEWTGFKVCRECFEPKHPQLEPPRHPTDPEALRQARPEIPLPQSQLGVVRTYGPSNITASGVNVGGQPLHLVDPIGSSFETPAVESGIGTVTVVIT